MKYSSINIQGNIISSEILDKIRSEEKFKHQSPEAFGLSRSASLRDEIGLAWSILRTHWQAYKKRLETLPKGDTGTSLTREKWILPLLTELGYQVGIQRAQQVNGKSYAISHGASNRDNFPVHIMGYRDSLDKRRETGGPRLSPHALVQEYLNNTEHLYAIVTNGRHLRLLRDATRLVRMSYLEFDLERMFEEELYADFSLLFRVLHITRMPQRIDQGPESVIEYYHQESMASGTRIREKLSEAVEVSIKTLANGFLQHPSNEELSKLFENQKLNADDYYMYQLRLIYRILFLIVLEERQLIYSEDLNEEGQRKRNIYYKYYSIERLRRLTESRVYVDGDKVDLWESLKTTFLLFENGFYGEKLGIKPLGSGLFALNALGGLMQYQLKNADLLEVLKRLTTFINEQGQLVRVNYSDLDVEEFGSVYEGLLEYDPKVEKIGAKWQFSFIEGDGRSSSGSHYTPEELVKPLIKHSLDYIIADKVASGEWLVVKNNSDEFIKIAPYEIFKKLSGIDSLAEINALSATDLYFYKVISERRAVWHNKSNTQSSSEYTGQHSRGASAEHQGGVSAISGHSEGLFSGARDFNDAIGQLGITETAKLREAVKRLRGDQQVNQWVNQIAQSLGPLKTGHCSLSTLPTEDALLSITVCDVACGSGHILLSAARRIATELASIREGAEQPSPTYYRAAIRDVIRNCIYGVDLNPLAVELCKVALWLEAHNPNEPLNFLDHHIKNGNAIVGLAHFEELENGIATEAFKTLPGDDKELAATLRKKNEAERKTKGQLGTYDLSKVDDSLKGLRKEFADFTLLPESTPEEIAAKVAAYQKLTNGTKWWRLKNLADLQVAQFFIPKTLENKERLTTDKQYRTYLNSGTQILDRGASLAKAQEKKFFHWFLEFPEVFSNGGFDCVLGNPPFLGGQKLSGIFGDAFLEYIKCQFAPIGAVDLVTYFFRRIFTIIKPYGFQSLISTNTVAQGKAREYGLDIIVQQGGYINYAVKSTKWPGEATVEVAIVTIAKQKWRGPFVLGGKVVDTITPYLDTAETTGYPIKLAQNAGKSFQGSIVLGKGFVLEPDEAEALIAKDPRNKDVLYPYLNGDDLNNNPDQSPSRWVINFFDWSMEKAKTYPDCFEIIERLVKPERQRWAVDKDGNEIEGEYALRKPLPEKWWIYGEKRPALYNSISKMHRILFTPRVVKNFVIDFAQNDMIFSDSGFVFALNSYYDFLMLNNSLHESWAWKNCSTMGAGLRYTASSAFETFPSPQHLHDRKQLQLETIGEAYHKHRRQLMLGMQLGLTKTYNLFHNNAITAKAVNEEDKQVAALKKHLEKTDGTIPFQGAIHEILKLRELHVQMDEAALAAYGWHEDSDKWGKAIQLRHDFYEVDYLPENDRVRYTIHPDARKEVLKRLLLLNHDRFEEEVAQGLHKKKDVEAYYEQKGKPIPAGTIFSDKNGSTKKQTPKKVKANTVQEPQSQYGLFGEESIQISEGSKVTLEKSDGQSFKYHILKSATKGEFTGDYKQISLDSGLAKALLGKKKGDEVEFGGISYKVINLN